MTEFDDLLQTLAVAAIVATCVLYSAWRLTSARFHLRVISLFEGWMGAYSPRWVAALRNSVLAKLSAGGCGACSSNAKATQLRPGPESKT